MFAPSRYPTVGRPFQVARFLLDQRVGKLAPRLILALAAVPLAGCFDEVPEPKSTKDKTPADTAATTSDVPATAVSKGTTEPPAKVIPIPARVEPIVRPSETPPGMSPALRTFADPMPADPPLSKVVIRDKREWDLPEAAARSLGKIGAAAVPELTKDLNNRDPEVRERAANVLARIGPAAKLAVPDLIAALEDDDETVRRSAAIALGQIGPAAADAVPALMRVMKEPSKVKQP